MKMKFKILSQNLLAEFKNGIEFSVDDLLKNIEAIETPVDYFQFYNSISSVYSSKIEGEDIDFDSFYKHKFLKVEYKPDYTKRADDLFKAYEFIFNNELSLENLLKAHQILSFNLLPDSQQGRIRNNPMFVINSEDRIEYVAPEASLVLSELKKLFADINLLIKTDLSSIEVFYYASFIHLVFVKIHPFQDGNGRTARLLEKWFLISKLGMKATSVQLEKNYYQNLSSYYSNIKIMGIEYQNLDYSKAIQFLSMTIVGISK